MIKKFLIEFYKILKNFNQSNINFILSKEINKIK